MGAMKYSVQIINMFDIQWFWRKITIHSFIFLRHISLRNLQLPDTSLIPIIFNYLYAFHSFFSSLVYL